MKRKLIYIVPSAVLILIVGISLLLASSGHFNALAKALHMSASENPAVCSYTVNDAGTESGSGQSALNDTYDYDSTKGNGDPKFNGAINFYKGKNYGTSNDIMYQSRSGSWYIGTQIITKDNSGQVTYNDYDIYTTADAQNYADPTAKGVWSVADISDAKLISVPTSVIASSIGSACSQTTPTPPVTTAAQCSININKTVDNIYTVNTSLGEMNGAPVYSSSQTSLSLFYSKTYGWLIAQTSEVKTANNDNSVAFFQDGENLIASKPYPQLQSNWTIAGGGWQVIFGHGYGTNTPISVSCKETTAPIKTFYLSGNVSNKRTGASVNIAQLTFMQLAHNDVKIVNLNASNDGNFSTGPFIFDTSSSGDIKINIIAAGFLDFNFSLQPANPYKSSETANIQITPNNISITGKVVNSVNKNAIVGANVIIEDLSPDAKGMVTTTTGPSGNFTANMPFALKNPGEPSSYELIVSATGYRGSSDSLSAYTGNISIGGGKIVPLDKLIYLTPK